MKLVKKLKQRKAQKKAAEEVKLRLNITPPVDPKTRKRMALEDPIPSPKKPLEDTSKSIMSSFLKTETMGKYKKQVKAEVAAAQKETLSNTEAGIETIAKSQLTPKEIREEARKRRKNKSGVTRTESPLARYKCSYNSKKKSKKSSLTKNVPFGSLSVEAGIDKNHNATQADRIVGAQKNN